MRTTNQEDIMRGEGFFPVSDVTEATGVTRMAVAHWIRDGKVKVVRVGRRTYLDGDSLAGYLGAEAMRIFGLEQKDKGHSIKKAAK